MIFFTVSLNNSRRWREGVGFPIYDNLGMVVTHTHTHACTIAWRGGTVVVMILPQMDVVDCGCGTIGIPNNMRWFGFPTPPPPSIHTKMTINMWTKHRYCTIRRQHFCRACVRLWWWLYTTTSIHIHTGMIEYIHNNSHRPYGDVMIVMYYGRHYWCGTISLYICSCVIIYM